MQSSVRFRFFILGVTVPGISAVIAAHLAVCTKTGHPRFGIVPLLFLSGVFILVLQFLDLRKGFVAVRKPGTPAEYYYFDRHRKPVGFWWHILFFSMVGALVICGSIILAFVPWKQ